MTKDAKAAEARRLAEALRANLRRRKAAQAVREAPERATQIKDGPRETPADNAS